MRVFWTGSTGDVNRAVAVDGEIDSLQETVLELLVVQLTESFRVALLQIFADTDCKPV